MRAAWCALWLAIPGSAMAEPCAQYTRGVQVGRLSDSTLNELSGLARASDGNYWAHNDSGDVARVFKLSPTGEVLGTVSLNGVDAVDFEDMTNMPCGDAACVVVADIGNNVKDRGILQLHRFAEPVGDAVDVETVSFSYPDTRYDAEAIFATADAVYVITKDGNRSRLFRVPWTPGETVVATLEADFGDPLAVTAADLAPDGSQLVVRGYFSVAYFPVVDGDFAAALGAPPSFAPFQPERQGEAVVYAHDEGLVTIGEAVAAVVNHYACAPDSPVVADAGSDAAVEVPDAGKSPQPNDDTADAAVTPSNNAPASTPDSCAGGLPIVAWLVALRRRRRAKILATTRG